MWNVPEWCYHTISTICAVAISCLIPTQSIYIRILPELVKQVDKTCRTLIQHLGWVKWSLRQTILSFCRRSANFHLHALPPLFSLPTNVTNFRNIRELRCTWKRSRAGRGSCLTKTSKNGWHAWCSSPLRGFIIDNIKLDKQIGRGANGRVFQLNGKEL